MIIDFEKVFNEYGLKYGDKVVFNGYTSDPYTLVKGNNNLLYLCNCNNTQFNISILAEYEWEKVEPKKTVGDLNCEEVANDIKKIKCSGCPLKCISCENGGPTLNDIAKETFKKYPQLEPMREWIEKELNKEIEE